MNSQVMKHLIGILLESPLYLTLSRRERHRLLNDFVGLYAFFVETPDNMGAGEQSVLARSADVSAKARKAAR